MDDPWLRLRAFTRARIGLGRAGDGLLTRDLLDFQLAHARARDAIHGEPHFEDLAREIDAIVVESDARDRVEYLRRPDLGRRLSTASRGRLQPGDWDVVFVIADGLSAAAVNNHAFGVYRAAARRLADWRIAPVVLARNARVALGDEIAQALGARICAILIGERPGLSVANSLGVYLTWIGDSDALRKFRDSERNCISNIHADGLSYEGAADRLVWLAREAAARKLTGVNLKDSFSDGGSPKPKLQ